MGLIDFGAVKTLDEKYRISLAKLFIAFDRNDRSEILRIMRELGLKTKYEKDEVILKLATFWFDRDDVLICRLC